MTKYTLILAYLMDSMHWAKIQKMSLSMIILMFQRSKSNIIKREKTLKKKRVSLVVKLQKADRYFSVDEYNKLHKLLMSWPAEKPKAAFHIPTNMMAYQPLLKL